MSAETPRPSVRRFETSAFWLSLWLAIPLAASKAVHWGRPEGDYSWKTWLRDIVVSSGADIAFVLGFGAAVFVLLIALQRWPRAARIAGFTALGFGAVCAWYAVASVQIFGFLRAPLTYTLLYLAGDMKSMRSSIGSFVTPTIVATMVLVPAAYVALAWLSCRRAAPPRLGARLAAAAVVAVGCLWAHWGMAVADGRWSDRPDLLISESPHWELLSSLANELRGGADVPSTKQSFPPEFLADFSPSPRGSAATVFQASVSAPAAERATKRPRNVIEVVLETTGARYLSLYGSPYKTTPNLDAAAQNALVYDNFYANVGFTANSLFVLTLSQHPYMTWREYTQEYPAFPGDTLAEVLKPRGYRSAFMTSGYLDYVCMGCFLKDRGFDAVEDWTTVGRGREQTSWGGNDEAPLVDHTLQWIDQDRGKPFYLELWTQQSHHPYEPTPGLAMTDFFAGRELPPDDYDLGRYLNTLQQVDIQLGRLFAGLKARGLDQDTIVVITGDHGEGFGDPHRTWGHGFRLYQEGIRVPLVIWSPALFPQGRRVDAIGGHVDVNPTLVELLGIPAPASWEGRSLFAADRVPRTYFYAANDDYLLGVRQGNYKLIFNVTRGKDELYDLARDPDEKVNIAAAHRELCAELRQRLAAWKSHAAGRLEDARRTMAARAAAGAREASLRTN
jgi:arylsulfatase A-like enzyme